ncbi:glutathione S-transferase family protein [Evansella sp. AB-rgal1]|uniref:glutathione S-transferase family protein n=1 Tax=Evansella sp. AB-rgal1 TaxID=3242696 RepID=UPI00359EF595
MVHKEQPVSCSFNGSEYETDKELRKKPEEISVDGSFKRQTNRFTTPFGEKKDELPVEAGRYRLLWSPACPWAHRSVIVRKVLGLEKVISLGTASPLRPKIGRVDWEFSLDKDNVDPLLGIQYISEIYLKSDPEYSGRPTVPVIVDMKEKKAVNNDYFKLTNYFETVWFPFHKENAPDLYPINLQEEIDSLNDIIFHDVNNGVYKCGFAQSQESYEEAYDTLFSRLDDLEQRLSSKRFLFGDYITDSDVRLYATMIRFDVAYYNGFNTNRNLIREMPNLWGYLRDLYETPGFGDTTDFHAIKQHYHLSITINPDNTEEKILPKGPDVSVFRTPHHREKLSNSKEKFLVRSK